MPLCSRSIHFIRSELSQLTKKWEKLRERGKLSRFLTRDKDEAALRTFVEGVGRVLQRFQASNLPVWQTLADSVLLLGRRSRPCPSTTSQG